MQLERDKQGRREPVDRERPQQPSQAELLEKAHKTPVWMNRQGILDKVRESDRLVLIGGTGSGKTTMIYPVLQEILQDTDRIVITLPRKKATQSTAKYVADLVGSRLGDKVAYQYRGSWGRARETEKTQATFTTDGSLKSRLQHDPLLTGITHVVIDEVHERTINIDTLLALLLKTQELRQRQGLPTLKLITMSATAEADRLKAYLSGAPVETIPGRMFNVESFFHTELVADRAMPQAAAKKAFDEILLKTEKKEGDILVFMPGKGEIKATHRALQDEFRLRRDKLIAELGRERAIKMLKDQGVADENGEFNIDLFEFHAQMSEENQNKTLAGSTKRKIIVATDAAETSLTIKSLRYVIDSGLVRQTEFDPKTGIESLKLTKCAKSSLAQRKGRAGRVQEGEYYPLFTQEDFDARQDFKTPEIKRQNLMDFVLTLKKFGVDDPSELRFIDQPPKENLDYAVQMLQAWGALDAQGKITKDGELMADLSVDPRYAYLTQLGAKLGCAEQASTIAAYLNLDRPLFLREEGKEDAKKAFQDDKTSDFVTALNFWEQYERNKDTAGWFEANQINRDAARDLERTRKDLLDTLQQHGYQLTSSPDPDRIKKAITGAFFDRLMVLDPTTNKYRAVLNNLSGIDIDPGSATALSRKNLIIIGDENDSSKAQQVQTVELKWIEDLNPKLVTRQTLEPKYDAATDQVVQITRRQLQNTLVHEDEAKPLAGSQATDVFAKALANEEVMHPVTRENRDTVRRINVYNREHAKPEFSKEQLQQFYRERLGTIASLREMNQSLEEQKVNLSLDPNDYIRSQEAIAAAVTSPDAYHGGAQPVEHKQKKTLRQKIASVVQRFVDWVKRLFTGGGKRPMQPQHA